MKLSLNWLKDFIDINVTPKELSDALTMSGSKVEGYHIVGSDISGVVVGKILSVEKHPNADKLSVCMCDVGRQEPLQIVTGAKNVSVGDLVPVALDGSTLPNGIKIKKGKLRDVVSNGMFCSINELNVTKNDFPYADEDGILLIQEDCFVGQDIKDALKLNDTSVEFEITSNRPDCLSVIGLARETAATFDKSFTVNEIKFNENSEKIGDYLKVSVEEPSLCLRYCARVIKNVKIEPSPLWMRQRLRESGVRPINNIVDITNYVMLEYGQPMHAFDYSCVNGKEIIVRCAKENETMNTLDGQPKELDSSVLVIADNQKPIALAGVMGGENSEIKENTSTIVFESASFLGSSVRLSSKKYSLRTESSARFEKGLDPNNAILALNRACELVSILGAGEIVGGFIDINNSKKEPLKFPLESKWINEFLATDLTEQEMVKILQKLDIAVDDNKMVTIPSFRGDLEHKADIAEEIARIYGYNNIATTMFKGTVTGGLLTSVQKTRKIIDETLLGCGLNEICTYSFISPKYLDKILVAEDSVLRNTVTIKNPLGEDTSIMRTTPLPSMLEALSRNFNFRNEKAALYEIATVYIKNEDEDSLPTEKQVVTIGLYDNEADFFVLKGIVEAVLTSLNIENYEFVTFANDPSFHKTRTAKVLKDGREIGILGQISPYVEKNYELCRTYCAMLDLNTLIELMGEEKQYRQLPKYPATKRDLALICDEDLAVGEIVKTIKSACGGLLEEVKLFDVYKGKQIADGKKSVAYSITLRAKDRTLEDAEVNKTVEKLFRMLEKINVFLRS